MADSEHDEIYEDAEDSGDERPAAKTRKTASGRVLIHSKEGINFKHLKSTYALSLGGEPCFTQCSHFHASLVQFRP